MLSNKCMHVLVLFEPDSQTFKKNFLSVFIFIPLSSIPDFSWQILLSVIKTKSSEIVQTRRLRLAGHVLRLPDVRPARVAMTWIPESGRGTSGRPQMTWRTSFKEDLHRMNLTWHSARRAASDRHRWRNLVAQCHVRDRRN